jgi:hypothetical protein
MSQRTVQGRFYSVHRYAMSLLFLRRLLCVRLKVQLDVHGFICIRYFIVYALHVSAAVFTHHQEHKLQSTAIGMRNGYGM